MADRKEGPKKEDKDKQGSRKRGPPAGSTKAKELKKAAKGCGNVLAGFQKQEEDDKEAKKKPKLDQQEEKKDAAPAKKSDDEIARKNPAAESEARKDTEGQDRKREGSIDLSATVPSGQSRFHPFPTS